MHNDNDGQQEAHPTHNEIVGWACGARPSLYQSYFFLYFTTSYSIRLKSFEGIFQIVGVAHQKKNVLHYQ